MRWLLLFFFAPTLALADCQKNGPDVVCDRGSFDTLVERCVEADKGATVCAIHLAAAEEAAARAQRALDACIAAVPPPPPKPSAVKPGVGYALGVLGAAALASALAADFTSTGRVTLGVAGLAAVGVGVVFVLP